MEHLSTSISNARIPSIVFLNKCDAIGAQADAAKMHFSEVETIIVSAKNRRESRDALESFIGKLRSHTREEK